MRHFQAVVVFDLNKHGQTSQQNPPTVVRLPPHFHPILVDRVAQFIYTSHYDFDPKDNADDLKNYTYHLRMYALAEELEYPNLKGAAYHWLIQFFLRSRGNLPSVLIDFVNATFARLGTDARICKDEDGALHILLSSLRLPTKPGARTTSLADNLLMHCSTPSTRAFGVHITQ